MSYYTQNPFELGVSLGAIPGFSALNKFGESIDCDLDTPTDIWDGADGSTSTAIWVAPTEARVHALVSGDAADAAAGTGARTVRVTGLTSWSANEVTETVTLNGTTPVNTVNAYVIIHDLQVLTAGSGGTNAGVITATAATDATVTAAIRAGLGKSFMAIHGVPSTKKLVVNEVSSTMLRSVNAVADVSVMVRQNAGDADSVLIMRDTFDVSQVNSVDRAYHPPQVYDGPCIVLVRATSDTNGAEVTASIDGYLVDV